MAKLKEVWSRNEHGHYIVELTKSRGKITVDEIANHLRYESRHYGFYAIIINANEVTCEPQGFYYEEPKGDKVELVELESHDKCPFCSALMPDPDYCPECGTPLKKENGT